MAYTLQQLLAMSWIDEAQAVKDLNKAGLKPVGEDYELRRHGAHSWQLFPRHDNVAQLPAKAPAKAGNREQRTIDALKKKPGQPAKGAPVVIAHAKKPASKPQPAPKTGNGETPTTNANANKPAPPVDLWAGAKPTADAPAAALPGNEGPYELVIRVGFAQNNVVFQASAWAKRLGVPVLIRKQANGGTILREMLPGAARRATPAASGAKRAAPPRQEGPSQFDRAAALLFRKQGATAKDLTAIWPDVGQRHINRAAKLKNATIEQLGEKHWRLVKA